MKINLAEHMKKQTLLPILFFLLSRYVRSMHRILLRSFYLYVRYMLLMHVIIYLNMKVNIIIKMNISSKELQLLLN